ncbi:putative permease [Marinomonas sp. MED121]|uniref:permease n=1 Tax=Marinomonas sp. MED121 TaxID=314277 RepID=UPI00006911DD|nr:permease [Marinomonas sp. MED121]EAQ67705.1 putative permease [Marinomonas sp. MED121]
MIDLSSLGLTGEMQTMLMDSLSMFINLFIELTLLFLAISYLVSVINQKLPADKIQALLGGRKGRGYLTAAGLGAITPFCSCSTIPMLIGLLKARAGFGPTITFLFTSPLLNPIVIALFVPILGFKITLLYASLALVVSVFAGVLLQSLGFERFIKQEMLIPTTKANACASSDSTTNKCTSSKKAPSIWRTAWQETWPLFMSMLPYMIIAMMIGSFVHGFVPAEFFSQVANADNPVAVPTAALIGIPLYIRVSTLLPLVGSFLAKGVSIGAVMALVIGSGGASLPELILLKRLFQWPMLVAFLLVIFSMAVFAGFTFNLLFA